MKESEILTRVREIFDAPGGYLGLVGRNRTEKLKDDKPLVADVMAGRVSIQDIVEPIVAENMSLRFPNYWGACSSKRFQKQAREAYDRLEGVLSLQGLIYPMELPVIEIWIAASVTIIISAGIWLLVPGGTVFGLGAFEIGIVLVLLGVTKIVHDEMQWFASRREAAVIVKRSAQLLDSLLKQLGE